MRTSHVLLRELAVRGTSLEVLAEKCGYSETAIKAMLDGSMLMSERTTRTIADEFGVSSQALLGMIPLRVDVRLAA